MPCHMKETLIGGTEDIIREDCVRDPEAVYEYVHNMATVVWFNYGVFKHNEFTREERISKRSSLLKYKTGERDSIWRDATVHVNKLQDETGLFKGKDEVDFMNFKFGDALKPSSFN